MKKLLLSFVVSCITPLVCSEVAHVQTEQALNVDIDSINETVENLHREIEWAAITLSEDMVHAFNHILKDESFEVLCHYAKELTSSKKIHSLRLLVFMRLYDIARQSRHSLPARFFSFNNGLNAMLIAYWYFHGSFSFHSNRRSLTAYAATFFLITRMIAEEVEHFYFPEEVKRLAKVVSLLPEVATS